MASRTIQHQSWDIFGQLTAATEYLLPCASVDLPTEIERPAWVQQFVEKDGAELAAVWNRHLDLSQDKGLRELVLLLRDLRPDGLLPWEGRYWVHFGLPEALSPDVLKRGEHFFDHYWSKRPGFYLPSPPSESGVPAVMASVSLPCDPTTIEFLLLFSGLREETPWDAGYFIDLSCDWGQVQKDYAEATIDCDGARDWSDAMPLYFAANGDAGVLSPTGAMAWIKSAERRFERFTPNFSEFVLAMVRVKRRKLAERFDSYSEPA